MIAIPQEEAIGLEPLDFYKDANDPRANSETTLHDLIDAIRSDEFADHVAEVRRLYAYMEDATNATERKERKDIADACKKQLPAVSLSGTVKGRRKAAVAENRFKHSGLLQIDLDGKDNIGWTVEEMRAVLKADPRIGAGLVSPSGKGVKGVARIPADVATHDACFMAAQAHFKSLNLTIDPSCKDPVRLCFVSHDPDAWVRMDGTEMFMPAEIPEVLDLGEGKDIAPKARGTRENRPHSPEKHASGGVVIRGGVAERDWTLADLSEMIAPIPRLDYGDWLAVCSGAWNNFGAAATSVLAARWPEEAEGEYESKFKAKTADHTIGTVIHFAKEHGWRPLSVRQAFAPHFVSTSSLDVKESTASIDLTKYSTTDTGNAERLQDFGGSNFRYVRETGDWLFWDGCRWSAEGGDDAMKRLFIQVMKLTGQQSFTLPPDAAKALARHALSSLDSAKITSGLQVLRALGGVSISVNAMNADTMILGTPDGMIDLRSGGPIAPDRDLLVTKAVGCNYDPQATCPTWEKFLSGASCGDLELIRFLQKSVGYTLTGSNDEQCLFFLHGNGKNGKGVFIETLKALMGDYGRAVPESMFAKERFTSSTTDIAVLEGCRFAITSELEEGVALAEARVKALTGGDTITARHLYKEPFEFLPTHHFWISGNYKPNIKGTDGGIWRRIRLLPFLAEIALADRDPQLRAKLRRELPGILRWAVEGCRLWQSEGLEPPACVARATDAYRAEEDVLGDFLAECCIEERGGRELISSIYEAYRGWAEKGGLKHSETIRGFNRKLEARGFAKQKSSGGRFWRDLELKTD